LRDAKNQEIMRSKVDQITTLTEKIMLHSLKLRIEKGGIRMPRKRKTNPIKTALSRMGIGDRVMFPAKYYARIVPLVYHYGRTLGVKVTIRRLNDDTYAFWRVVAELL